MLMESRFIEENNVYKNQQKQIQQNQRMPPGMASQDLMAYWGTVTAP
jgi:RAT1-interacting protein